MKRNDQAKKSVWSEREKDSCLITMITSHNDFWARFISLEDILNRMLIWMNWRRWLRYWLKIPKQNKTKRMNETRTHAHTLRASHKKVCLLCCVSLPIIHIQTRMYICMTYTHIHILMPYTSWATILSDKYVIYFWDFNIWCGIKFQLKCNNMCFYVYTLFFFYHIFVCIHFIQTFQLCRIIIIII